MSTALPPAGWYPAPDDASRERWWNGVDWSDQYRQPGAAFAAPTAPLAPTQPWAPHPPHPQQAWGQPVSTSDGMSLAGFIVAIVSLFVGIYGIVGVVAAIISGIALQRANADRAKGIPTPRRSLAIAGLVIGIVGAVLGFSWAVFVAMNPEFITDLITGGF